MDRCTRAEITRPLMFLDVEIQEEADHRETTVKKKAWVWLVAVVIGIGALTPSYVRAYRVAGSSDAPSFLVGDRIIVNKAAYDLRLPYTNIRVLSHSHPQWGDVVLFRPPGQDSTVFKRVVGCPGNTVAMHDNHLEINGTLLQYERVTGSEHQTVAKENDFGAIIESETGMGRPHLMTHTPGASDFASFGPVQVPGGHYFLLGDNRDNSTDSRMYGTVPRRAILGKVYRASDSAP